MRPRRSSGSRTMLGALSRLASERGSHLVEVAIGMLVLSVGVLGVLGSMASGVGLVGHSRQRSAAVAVALEHLERVRSLPYERIALRELPTHNADPDHPDNDVTEDNLSYRVSDTAIDPLVVDTEGGALQHSDDTQTLGETALSVYQYVTWVDDPTIAGGQNYKRVIVVATWKLSLKSGITSRVVQSTFVSDGTVTVPEGTPPPAEAGSPGAVASPIPPPSCTGDTEPPIGSIELIPGSGAEQDYTDSTSIQVRLDETDACSHVIAELSNDGVSFTEVATHVDSQPVTVAWSIPTGDGSKTVYARFRDTADNASGTLTDQIVLDSTPPSIPGNLRVVSCSTSGSSRMVTLTWDASTDVNLLGYRLFRSIESGRFVEIVTTATTSAADTERKSYGSVRYTVRAYDKVGNESGDSNIVSFSRNGC